MGMRAGNSSLTWGNVAVAWVSPRTDRAASGEDLSRSPPPIARGVAVAWVSARIDHAGNGKDLLGSLPRRRLLVHTVDLSSSLAPE